MNLEQLKHLYNAAPLVNTLGDKLNTGKTVIQAKGLIGSAVGLVANGVFTKRPGNYLFILADKEEAAYFSNNIESIIGADRGTTQLFYPASYRRPYQIEEIDNANIIQRTEVLNTIRKKRKNTIIVTYPEAIIENVVTRKNLDKNTLEIEVEKDYSIDFINELLIEYDFEKVDHVYHPGQFAVRGGIVDIYSFSNDLPYRVEFFGDEVESIRIFNPEDQLSVMTVKRFIVVPNVSQKLIEATRESFLNYIPQDTCIWIKDFEYAKSKIDKGYEKAQSVYEKMESEVRRLTPAQLYLAPVDFHRQIEEHSVVEFGNRFHFKNTEEIIFNQAPQPPFNKNFELLISDLNEKSKNDYINIISATNENQLNRLDSIFTDIGADVKYHSLKLDLHEGFIDKDLSIACYTDHQIFERYHKFRLKEGYKKSEQAFTLKEIYNLQKGDFVTHIDHGVGQFSGLEKIDVNGTMQEAVRLLYKGGDILYVSIHSLHRISKYSSKEGAQPSLNKLGSPAWTAAKNKAKKRIKEVAFDLIQLYAKRKASKGFAFSPDTYLQDELEASFIFEDTADQVTATIKVKEEMESDSPMDLLICGDVGFGKTEIAIRAALKAAADGKQTAVLVPTTVLAFQHYQTFSERLKGLPVEVDYVNRFKTGKKNAATLARLKSGKLDIIIGTHKLAGKGVEFHDLGLLIIDEEQKFGVSVKDKLKTLKENVDTLTLTATPIPRTLQFSLMNARDLCVLNTPPANRYPIDTIIQPFSEETIRDAIAYEVQRGGQVFFVNNRVQNINEVAGLVKRLCPDAKVAVGHGQMEGNKLEAVIMDFMEGSYDVLVATTIIEAGIDVPNANTIIINNAHHFGLSDLHQLRGRVGRSNKKAFAYLFTPPPLQLTDEARKRLTAIEQFSDLGSGLKIAMRDLDIRGAGDLLGANQSGFITDIGFDTYQKILDEAINELKETEFKELFKDELANKDFVSDCQLETDLNLVIPDDYVNDITVRLGLYRELDDCKNKEDLAKFESKLLDQFGEIPTKTKDLIRAIKMRWLAKDIGMEKLILKKNTLIGTFVTDQNSAYYQSEDFTRVLMFIKHNHHKADMAEKKGKLRLRFDNIMSVKEGLIALKEIVDSKVV
ncbi:MAG: transcription-repair coupling factor (superfamily II helicase) [Parvicella sp.]